MSYLQEDTIAAIATPYGTSGVGKIRVSGPRAIKIAERVFRGKADLGQVDTHTAHHGYVVEPETGKYIDEVVVIIMKKPRSFTGENVAEFDCHGGMVPLRKVLETILKQGARMAEPGEFSRRAFLNGKIDIAQAEGIMEVINSRTETGLEIAVDQLTGKLSQRIKEIEEEAMGLLAHLEAAIDFPEDEIEGFDPSRLDSRVQSISENISKLLATSRQGRIYKEGIKTVIVGKPNVGKSSLLNLMLEEKRAIVTEIPGTTRDIIEEYINLEGIPLKIIDTAGIRDTEDAVEKIGVKKTRDSLDRADLVLMMLDVSQGLTEEDLEVYSLIKDKPVLVLINKTDLPPQIEREQIKNHFPEHTTLWISVKEEQGLEELKQAIIDEVFAGEIEAGDSVLITRVRHKQALEAARESINRVQQGLQRDMPYDFLTIDLKDCLDYLGQITGETVDDNLLDRIFSDFCIGK